MLVAREALATSHMEGAVEAQRRLVPIGYRGDDLVKRGVGVGAHLVVVAILDGVRREHSSHRGKTE